MWKDKKTRLVLFGDYEFLSLSYGLSGPAGVRSYMYCRASKAAMQLPLAPFAERSLHSMNECYKSFSTAGHVLAKAKHFYNCIRPSLFCIEPQDVCVPVLHLDLGIFPWLFESMIRDAKDIDTTLAQISLSVSESASAEFSKAVRQQQQIQHDRDQLQTLNTQMHQKQFQLLQWLLQQHNLNMQQQHIEHVSQTIQTEWRNLQQSAQKLEAEIERMKTELDKSVPATGPCVQSFEPVLQRHHIHRQAYHSGAFVGNHIHMALQDKVIAEL